MRPPLFGLVVTGRGCWFRFFGFGLSWRDAAQDPPTFSERNGCVTAWVLRGRVFRLLVPWR